MARTKRNRQVRVGISACLLGQRVRYDGGHQRHDWLVDGLGPRVTWVPVCPEVELGLAVPREAIQLVDATMATVAPATVASAGSEPATAASAGSEPATAASAGSAPATAASAGSAPATAASAGSESAPAVPASPRPAATGAGRSGAGRDTSGGGLRLIGAVSQRDFTAAMQAFAATRVAALADEYLAGYVLKTRSPSCGLTQVKVFARPGAEAPYQRRGRGLFAAALVARFPGLPVIEDHELDTPEMRATFVTRVWAYHTRYVANR